MSVNEIKTNIMLFGSNEKITIEFNQSKIEHVDRYKYVGCLIQSINKPSADLFKLNYSYLCNPARKAVFGIKQKRKSVGTLPPKTLLYLFNISVKPILTYGSDVRCVYKYVREVVDKMFLKFIRHSLGVKQSTSTLMVYGETG